jgi:RimJ/RimL family protein N-acetyltransferase
MKFICLHEKSEIEQFLRKDIQLHIYSIGDLDDFFWPYTTWYGLKTNGGLSAVVLLYSGQSLPILLALSEDRDAIQELLRSIHHLLPPQFYAHLSPGLEGAFSGTHYLDPHGEHYKMALHSKTAVFAFDCSGVTPLSTAELEEIQEFYRESYPGNWFDPRMLETRQYFGIRAQGKLVSVGGIHVYSPQYRVAALGNIATHPSYRGQGYGKIVTAKVCQSVSEDVNEIGLNVKANNQSAIACYERLGFKTIAAYGEFMVHRK